MSGGAAVELQPRRASAANHFNVFPHHAACVTCAERLHGGFLRGEPSRQVRCRVPPAGTIRNLPLGKDALKEPIAVSIEERCEPGDVGGVQPDAKDGHERASA
jgi:hypothetical protein